jgi:hypothetical protein
MRDPRVFASFAKKSPHDVTSTQAWVNPDDAVSLISPRFYRILTIQPLKLYIQISYHSTIIDWVPRFYPSFLTKRYLKAAVVNFAEDNIETWHNVNLKAEVSCGKTMPTLLIPVCQFELRGSVLEHHIQYRQFASHKTRSVPIGMLKIDQSVVQQCDEYARLIRRDHIRDFFKLYWDRETNKLGEKLATILFNSSENELTQRIQELLIMTYMLSRTLSITKVHDLEEMLDIGPPESFPSPRLLNRQLKYVLHHRQQDLIRAIVSKLQGILESPNNYSNWSAGFKAIVGLCMVQEEQQQTFGLMAQTAFKDIRGQIHDGEVSEACGSVDRAMKYMMHAFARWGGSLHDVNFEDDTDHLVANVRRLVAPESTLFLFALWMQLMRLSVNFLVKRGGATITASNLPENALRLISRFLLL